MSANITTTITTTDKPTMIYLPQSQQTFKPPLIANENAFLGDVATSYVPPMHRTGDTNSRSSADSDKPISAGFYRLEKGTPLVYTYTYDEMKIILDGHFYIEDESGRKVKATKGDVFHFPKGSTITFTTDDFGLGFYTGQRAEGAA